MQMRFSTGPVVGAILTVLAVLALSLAPAFAQDGGVNQEIDEQDVEVEDSICTNVFQVANQQYNAGDQTANAGAEANAIADASANAEANANAVNIANVLDISVAQVNQCLNGADIGGNGDENKGDDKKVKTAETEEVDTAAARQYGVIVKTIPGQKVLANTGGPALLLPALGLLLIFSVVLRNLLRR